MAPLEMRSSFSSMRPVKSSSTSVRKCSFRNTVTTRAVNVGTRAFPCRHTYPCLLYTSDAADDLLCVDLGGRRVIKKKKNIHICHPHPQDVVTQQHAKPIIRLK